MKQSELDTSSARLYATLLTFKWSDQVRRYAAFNERVVRATSDWGGLVTTWDAAPAVKVEFQRQHGGAEDAPISILMPAALEPAGALVTGLPHAGVDVLVEEIEPGNDGTLRPVFFGRVVEATYNAAGLEGAVRLRVAGLKDRLSVQCGIAITNACVWTFGDGNCGVDVESLKVSATVDAIAGSVVTLDVAGPSARYYHRGWIMRDGARIMIREYTTGNDYTLVRPPPPGWSGQQVTLVPGCDKTRDVCDTRWSNLLRFGGAGLGIPAYNPVFESAS